MEINEKKFGQTLQQHKKKIAAIGYILKNNEDEDEDKQEDLENLFTIVRYQARDLCLVNSRFKCEKCGNKNDLQIHHLIGRNAKNFMDFPRYVTQRYYWANQIILCNKCHQQYHEELGHSGGQEENLTLDKDVIDKVKKEYVK